MLNWLALCAVFASLTINISIALQRSRFATSAPIVVNGTGTLLLNLSLSHRCARLILTLKTSKRDRGVRIAMDFVENVTEPISVTISELNIQPKSLAATSTCSLQRTVLSKITLRNDAIELRIGGRWQLVNRREQPHSNVLFVEVNKSADRCCFVEGTVEWIRMDRGNPTIKAKATAIQNLKQPLLVKSSSSSVSARRSNSSKIELKSSTMTVTSLSKPDPNAARRYPFTSRAPSHGVSFATYKKMGSAIDVSTKPIHLRNVRSNDINDAWTSTFLTFLGIEVFFVGSFIIFGLLMFAWLQTRPKETKVLQRHRSIQ